jgi:hypothetical protein
VVQVLTSGDGYYCPHVTNDLLMIIAQYYWSSLPGIWVVGSETIWLLPSPSSYLYPHGMVQSIFKRQVNDHLIVRGILYVVICLISTHCSQLGQLYVVGHHQLYQQFHLLDLHQWNRHYNHHQRLCIMGETTTTCLLKQSANHY